MSTTQSETAISPAEMMGVEARRMAVRLHEAAEPMRDAIDEHPDEAPMPGVVDALNLLEDAAAMLVQSADHIGAIAANGRRMAHELRSLRQMYDNAVKLESMKPPAPVVVQNFGRDISYAEMVEQLGEDGRLVT